MADYTTWTIARPDSETLPEAERPGMEAGYDGVKRSLPLRPGIMVRQGEPEKPDNKGQQVRIVVEPSSDTESSQQSVSTRKKDDDYEDRGHDTHDEDISYWSYSDSDSDSDGGASLYPHDGEEDEDSDEVSDEGGEADNESGRGAFPGGVILDDDFIRGEIEEALGF